MNTKLKTMYLPDVGPFNIRVKFHKETDVSMRDHFIKECEWSISEFEEIKDYHWVRIEVIASMANTDWGIAYLGGCCYKDRDDFKGTCIATMAHGYMPQLIEEAVQEANDNVKGAVSKLAKLLDEWVKL